MIGLALALCASTAAMASGGGPLFPSYISTLNTGVAYVYFTGARTGTIPACAAPGGTYFRYAFDTNTAGGKAQLANLLAAAAQGINIWFQGTGDCNVDGTTESLAQIHPDQA
jgi:hypothetical protein